jgi:hypothetical protein
MVGAGVVTMAGGVGVDAAEEDALVANLRSLALEARWRLNIADGGGGRRFKKRFR